MIKRIGLVSKSRLISQSDLAKVAAAINLQVTRDLQPIWSIEAIVSPLPDADAIAPGIWPVFIQDDINARGAAGLHLTAHNQPYALVEAGPNWSLTASHEVVEMLVDPSGNRLVSSVGIDVANGEVIDVPDVKVEYLVEVADPSEDARFAYLIDDVVVSDFYTPNFFDHIAASGVRYSFTGRIDAPRKILSGGYITWLDVEMNRLRQLRNFAQPQILTLPSAPAASSRRTLRGYVDEVTPPPIALSMSESADAAGAVRQERARWVQLAATRRAALFTAARVSPTPAASQQDVATLVNAHQQEFKDAGATRAYAGWHFENHWITHDRAVVVLARRSDVDRVRSSFPNKLNGVDVDVRVDPQPPKIGTPALDAFASMASGAVREELALPSMTGEVSFADDSRDASSAGALIDAMAARRSLSHEAYKPPARAKLAPITAQMTLRLHVSPEQGWVELRTFLGDIKKELVVGMYEFTAKHIEQVLLSALGGRQRAKPTLTLTLDSPGDSKKRDQTVEDTEAHLEKALTTRLDFAWALSGLGKESTAIMFPTAYHIKVAVKDESAVWLSSGNWNTSNQPDVDPTNPQTLVQAAKTSDRDWHVIAESEELAAVFKRYLANDFVTASQASQALATAAAAVGGVDDLPAAVEDTSRSVVAAATPKRFFDAKVIQGKLTVLPLLTPDRDGYRKPVIELIQHAKKRIYMQTQYIHPSDATDDQPQSHAELLAALADRIKDGLDVKLITSEYQDFMWIERVQDAGIDAVSHLRIQDRVHNKGIVVDSQIAVISSQNWSAQGTGSNRDAGLVIYNEDAARYFEEIFLHDWLNLASAKARGA